MLSRKVLSQRGERCGPLPIPRRRTNNLRTVYLQVTHGNREVAQLTDKITFVCGRKVILLSNN